MADPDVLGKADALLQRHRAARAAKSPEPPVDFPVLTEVVQGAPAAQSPAAPPPLGEAELAQIERDLRLELLGLLGPEFERLVEAKVHERLGAKVDDVLTLTRKVLEAEVRGAVREALAQVIAEEVARLQRGGAAD
ncbi:MAG: hypothetical protein ACREVS_14205 [Burkholderiales bacterium]